MGVIINIVCARNHYRLVQELNRGGLLNRPSWLAIGLALFLAVVGIAMAVYVISVREPRRENSRGSQEKSMISKPENGIVNMASHHSVEETVQKLEGILEAKGVQVFALVDHSGEAEKVGLRMRPTKLLIFGNPKAGTPLMLAAPSCAIDLPLKILVAEDAEGKVWISYNSASYLQERHKIPNDLVQNIGLVEALAAKAAE